MTAAAADDDGVAAVPLLLRSIRVRIHREVRTACASLDLQAHTGVWDMGYVGGMVYGNMGKLRYVVWYVLTLWYGKKTVYGLVRLWYRTMVRCRRGCIMWLNSPGSMVCFSI